MRKEKEKYQGFTMLASFSCRPAIEHPDIYAYTSRKGRSLASGTYYKDKINNTRACQIAIGLLSMIRIKSRNSNPMQHRQHLTGQGEPEII